MNENAAQHAAGEHITANLLARLERLETAEAARETAYRYARARCMQRSLGLATRLDCG